MGLVIAIVLGVNNSSNQPASASSYVQKYCDREDPGPPDDATFGIYFTAVITVAAGSWVLGENVKLAVKYCVGTKILSKFEEESESLMDSG